MDSIPFGKTNDLGASLGSLSNDSMTQLSLPLSMAPISGFKHKQQKTSNATSNATSNNISSTNTSTSPRPDSLENSASDFEAPPLQLARTFSSNDLPQTSYTTRRRSSSSAAAKKTKKPSTHHSSNRPTPDDEVVDAAEAQAAKNHYHSPLLSPFLHNNSGSASKNNKLSIPPLTKDAQPPPETDNKGIVLTGHRGPINHIVKLDSNSMIATSGGNELRLWNVQKGVCVGLCVDDSFTESNVRGDLITSLTTSSNAESGNNIISGHESGYIKIYDMGRNESGDALLSSRFLAHSGKVTCVISENSDNGTIIGSYPRIVSAGEDRVVALWDPRLRQPQVFKFKGHTDVVNCLLLDGSRSCVVSAGRDQNVKIWDIRTGRQRTSQNEHFGSVV